MISAKCPMLLISSQVSVHRKVLCNLRVIEWISLKDDDDVVEAIQLDLQKEILDSADGLEASDTPGATQNEQDYF